MQLKLEHIAPYLPYGLKMNHEDLGLFDLTVHTLSQMSLPNGEYNFKTCKPILRPLSDLTKEIEINGEKFIPADRMGNIGCMEVEYKLREDTLYFFDSDDEEKIKHWDAFTRIDFEDMRFTEWHMMESMLSWHFDVFRLIPENLAIDINTL